MVKIDITEFEIRIVLNGDEILSREREERRTESCWTIQNSINIRTHDNNTLV